MRLTHSLGGSAPWTQPAVAAALAAGLWLAPSHALGNEILHWGAAGPNNNIPTGDFTAVDGGHGYAVALRSDGSIVTWNGSAGPSELSTGEFTQISAGKTHAVALRADGTPLSWGAISAADPGFALSDVAAGDNPFNVGIRQSDGSLVIWGDYDFANTGSSFGLGLLPSGSFQAVAAGYFHAVAIDSDGHLVAWGLNNAGQYSVPTGTYSAVAVNAYNNIALRTDGTIVQWGTFVNAFAIPTGSFVTIAAGLSNGIALRADGTMVEWTDQNSGVGGAPLFGFPGTGTYSAIGGGTYFGLALTGLPPADVPEPGTIGLVATAAAATASLVRRQA